jgi:carbamoyl-phosphate synthase large subunit
MRLTGISGVVLTTSDEGDNRALINAVKSCPLEVWVFPWARPDDPELVLLVEAHRDTVRGLKVHPSLVRLPLDSPDWDRVFQLAVEHELQVIVHTGRWQQTAGYALALDRADKHSEVNVILSHAGGDTPDLCIAAAEEAKRRGLENVFFDMAGVREHWALVRAMESAGHWRYMMGSDFPLAPPAMYIAQIDAMPIPDQWKEDLLGGNARRLLGEPSRPSSEAAGTPPVFTPTDVVEAAGTPPAFTPPEVAGTRQQRCSDATVLITGAGGPLGVNVTRSLLVAQTSLRLIGTDANPYHLPLAVTHDRLLVPRASASDYLERITQIVRDHQVDLVVPTHPIEVRALSAVRQKVPARLFLPPHEAILAGQDKFRSYELFRNGGVPVPRSRKINEFADLERAFSELGPPPIWVRGAGVPGAGVGVASLPCREVEHARSWVEHHRGWGLFMASEYLPGDNLTWLAVWQDGELRASQTRQRLEYVLPHVSPSGVTGAPAVSRTVRRPEIREIGAAAVRAICPHPEGIFFVDFKSTAAGEPRVTEINAGRFGTTIHFYTTAGFNFPELAVRLALGIDLDRLPANVVHDPISEDTYWIRTLDCGPVLVPPGSWVGLPGQPNAALGSE